MQVDASMTHRVAKIVMPVGAVQPVAFIKIHHIRNIGQKITGTMHVGIPIFNVNVVLSRDRGILPCAGRNNKRIDHVAAFIGIYRLVGQIDIDPARISALSNTGKLPGWHRCLWRDIGACRSIFDN